MEPLERAVGRSAQSPGIYPLKLVGRLINSLPPPCKVCFVFVFSHDLDELRSVIVVYGMFQLSNNPSHVSSQHHLSDLVANQVSAQNNK